MIPGCYEAGYDNCLQACTAGILQMPITEVKDFNMFLAGNKNWYAHFVKYCQTNLQQQADAHVPEAKVDRYSIGIMRSIDMKTTHAVILKPSPEGGTPEVFWDPDPKHPIYKMCIAKITFRIYHGKVDMRDAMKIGEIDVHR